MEVSKVLFLGFLFQLLMQNFLYGMKTASTVPNGNVSSKLVFMQSSQLKQLLQPCVINRLDTMIFQLAQHYRDSKFSFTSFRAPSVQDISDNLFTKLHMPYSVANVHATNWDDKNNFYKKQFKEMTILEQRYITRTLAEDFKQEYLLLQGARITKA